MVLSLINLRNNPLQMLAVAIAFLSALFISMPAHEFAHAHAAFKEGDHTAKTLKRYTLAPFAHFDLLGFFYLIIFGIGFAKPVPVDPRNFKRGRKSEFRVAFAGILVNLMIGVVSCLLYSLFKNFLPTMFANGFIGLLYEQFFLNMISINFMFAFFNLLPLYPLDGYRIVDSFCRQDNKFLYFMRRYSFVLMLVLFLTHIIDYYIVFFADGLASLIYAGFNFIFGLFR